MSAQCPRHHNITVHAIRSHHISAASHRRRGVCHITSHHIPHLHVRSAGRSAPASAGPRGARLAHASAPHSHACTCARRRRMVRPRPRLPRACARLSAPGMPSVVTARPQPSARNPRGLGHRAARRTRRPHGRPRPRIARAAHAPTRIGLCTITTGSTAAQTKRESPRNAVAARCRALPRRDRCAMPAPIAPLCAGSRRPTRRAVPLSCTCA